MNDDDSRHNSDKSESGVKPKDPADSLPGGRREPVFTDFDEDEDYEEADRDTDYASAYEEEAEDEEYLEPLEDEDPDDISTEWQVLSATSARRAGGNPWEITETTSSSKDKSDSEVDELDTGRDDIEPDDYESEVEDDDFEDDDFEDDYEDYDPDSEADLIDDEAALANKSDDDWEDEEDYADELEKEPEEENTHSWPLGLVIVGIVALVLLAAGGYGVIQQRSATQEEIRQLQATLATAASPADVAASRDALRESQQRNENLEATVERLSAENRRLSDTVAGLKKQLAELAEAAASKPVAEPQPAPRQPAQTKPEPVDTASGGDWFVNFSSYSQRSVAESWAKKLKPSAGSAVVAASTRDGKTFYRVRIIGLPDRAAAQKVAGQLESTYQLPPLWVGSQ